MKQSTSKEHNKGWREGVKEMDLQIGRDPRGKGGEEKGKGQEVE